MKVKGKQKCIKYKAASYSFSNRRVYHPRFNALAFGSHYKQFPDIVLPS